MNTLKLNAAVFCVMTTVICDVSIADPIHIEDEYGGASEAISYTDYMTQVRIQTNANREFPDINFGGWRAMSWGSIVGRDFSSGIAAESSILSGGRTIISSDEGRLAGVSWNLQNSSKTLAETLVQLISIYGHPSESRSDATWIWRGMGSLLILKEGDHGPVISLLPAS